MNLNPSHQPVFLEEVLDALSLRSTGFYVDATFGRGGHSRAILNCLSTEGRLVAFDKDPQAIEVAQKLHQKDSRFTIEHASFTQLNHYLERYCFMGKVHGILADLGVSSPQLDEAERGFSFLRDGPLDMRMNPQEGVSAEQWLRCAPMKEINTVLADYGQERYARRIAQSIVITRKKKPIKTTLQLAELIKRSVPYRERKKHPATRSFQAIRIFINRELEDLDRFLSQTQQALSHSGRLVVISFHSLEDRKVKQFMRSQDKTQFRTVGRPLKAQYQHIQNNRRARSATLRVMEKLSLTTSHKEQES